MRHFLAPRAKTQDEMNLQMKGLEVELAERYTNMTKIIFLALWYSSIYPAGFYMAFVALSINYFTDRHSLMRTWKRAPPLGPGISEFSRRYFISTAYCAMALLSSYFWGKHKPSLSLFRDLKRCFLTCRLAVFQNSLLPDGQLVPGRYARSFCLSWELHYKQIQFG